MSTKIITGLVVGLSVLAIGGMIYGTSQRKAADGGKVVNSSLLNRFEPVNLTSVVAGLPQKVEGKVLVVDIFNYGCEHCAVIASLNEEVFKRNADKIHLVKISAPFAQWNQYTHLFYALESLGVESQLSADIFKILHQDKQKDLTIGSKALTDLLNKHNISIDSFNQAYNDPSISDKVAKSLDILKAYKVEGTPVMIVDNEKKFSPGVNGGYAEAAISMENAIIYNFSKMNTKPSNNENK